MKSIGYLPGINLAHKDIFIGVGLNNLLYTREYLSSAWVLVPNSGFVVDITVVILGTAPDGHLYTKKTLDSPWEWVPNSCCVHAQLNLIMADLWKPKEDLTVNWVLIPNSEAVVNIAAGYLTD
ncbi:hypothetical protein HDU79_008219 [Rhizoclosmatium sp. JEL0117]|nr:hypothetical protein HDU79_008219 [Rhizoclosmatium sp. JEL0117]